jgi:hypothetical protein
MRLRNANETSKSSLRKLAIAHFTPDVGQQLKASVLECQNGLFLYFRLK